MSLKKIWLYFYFVIVQLSSTVPSGLMYSCVNVFPTTVIFDAPCLEILTSLPG